MSGEGKGGKRVAVRWRLERGGGCGGGGGL